MTEWRVRFARYYQPSAEQECWLWQGALSTSGYGRFWLNGKARIASRIAFRIAYGLIPGGKCVLHRCDNPACVNPAHLFLGSHQENMADRNAKGRANGGRLRGERNPHAKLTADQAREIRRLTNIGALPQKAIAAQFRISQSQVSEIKHGRSW